MAFTSNIDKADLEQIRAMLAYIKGLPEDKLVPVGKLAAVLESVLAVIEAAEES